jgi:hypothetical protein
MRIDDVAASGELTRLNITSDVWLEVHVLVATLPVSHAVYAARTASCALCWQYVQL